VTVPVLDLGVHNSRYNVNNIARPSTGRPHEKSQLHHFVNCKMNDKGWSTNTMSTENYKYKPPSKATLVIIVIVAALQAAAN